MRCLPGLVIGAAVALAVTAEGCTDRACLEWNTRAEGACPSEADARGFFGVCSDVEQVLSAPNYLPDEGGLCCYDVIHTTLGAPIQCHKGTTSSTTTTTRQTGTGGGSTSTSMSSPTSSSGSSGGSGGGGSGGSGGSGGAPACEPCSQALTAGDLGDLCSGGSTESFTELVTCGCGAASCGSPCSDFCSVGDPVSATCLSCLEASCAAELSSCEAH